jgi:hypothetical protein
MKNIEKKKWHGGGEKYRNEKKKAWRNGGMAGEMRKLSKAYLNGVMSAK